MSDRKPIWLIIIVLLFVVVALPNIARAIPTDPDTVLMTYGEQQLTMRHILWVNPTAESDVSMIRKIADYWLDSQLLYEEAVSRNLGDDPRIKFLSDMAAKKVFAGELVNHVRDNVSVDANAVTKYYEENKEKDPSLKTPLYLSFSHVQTNTLAEAEDVRKRIEAGENINELAKELSVAKDAKKGGKAAKYQEKTVKGRFSEEFLVAFNKASEGEIIGPIKVKNDKYEVARHEGKRRSKLKPFKDVEKAISSRLDGEAKQKAIKKLFESLREKSKSKIEKMGVLKDIEETPKIEGKENKK